MASRWYVEKRVARSVRAIERSVSTLDEPTRDALMSNIRQFVDDELDRLPRSPARADFRRILSRLENPGTFLSGVDRELPAFTRRRRTGIGVGATALILLAAAAFLALVVMFFTPVRQTEQHQESPIEALE